MEDILDKYHVKPLVGVIPQNEDPDTMIDAEDLLFWEKVRQWENKGWAIAMHGYNHVCITEDGGINPVHYRSEFAGLSYEDQSKKITEGYETLKAHGIEPTYFFAPSHTYDMTTLKAILNNTSIRNVCDTIATKPYRWQNELVIVPCQMGRLREMPINGYWCACYHPNQMEDHQFSVLDSFLQMHHHEMQPFTDIPLNNVGSKSAFDKMLSILYFTMRRIKS